MHQMRESSMSELASLEVAVSPVEKFEEFLRTKGKRLTQERSIIVQEVFSGHEHFDAEQLVARLSRRRDGRSVSRSTVYRTLGWLEEAGLLRKVARTNDRDLYEHDYGYPQHDHLICGKCGELIEFHNQAISEILEEIAAAHGFRMSGHRLEVHGKCEKCSRPPQRRHRKLDMG
jgi:Fur family transcriptional regulator, ferric uptake regulator